MPALLESPAQPRPAIASRSTIAKRLLQPVDIAPLVFFRISFGFLMFVEVGRYFIQGKLRQHWADPPLHFTYFDWVPTLGPTGIAALGVALMAAAVGIAAGLFYRLCALIFGAGFTWLFLIEQSQYLNHFYLICLLSFVAAILPANRAFSLDARGRPALQSDHAPAWALWIVLAHMAIAYFYGGLAKLNSDWLQGEPIRTWMRSGILAEAIPPALKGEALVALLSYGGLALDLLIVPALLWKRTRLPALLCAIVFHLSNARLFSIGVFPFLSIALTLLFLPAEWHRKFLCLPRSGRTSGMASSAWLAPALVLYAAAQLLIPFRHFLYPGSVHWTEEGHRFSWHMMLRSKNGETWFVVRDGANLWKVDPRAFVTERQYRKMAAHPAMILQFAHYLREKWKPREVQIHAVARVTLNHRPPALLVDPAVDLAKVEKSWRPASWILPLGNAQSTPEEFGSARELKAGAP